MVAAALAGGGVVHAFGTGHSHMIAEEAFYRAGGIVAVNQMQDERLTFFKGALESTPAERDQGYARKLIAREALRDWRFSTPPEQAFSQGGYEVARARWCPIAPGETEKLSALFAHIEADVLRVLEKDRLCV